ncbi:unnamed protein product [Caenorhabditis bovis]|uniref:Nuclear condensin complex subunit 3 C-terminal domain-containing protein n=1 Tax=Caenorhabditis bovis TaxID=2654633 RepID=A0A8S1F6Z3_9PELO|nr:unnamed protein product [Caenorhabditis bovis]
MPPKKKIRGAKLSPVKETEDSTPTTSAESPTVVHPVESTVHDETEFDRLTISGGAQATQQAPDKVVQSFQTAFQAKTNIPENTAHACRLLLTAINRINKTKNPDARWAFFNELDIRLCMMIEDTTVLECRHRVLRVVCRFACAVLKDADDMCVLDFLYDDFVSKWALSTDTGARAFMATIIGFIFESGIALKKEPSDFTIFDLNYAGKLYTTLRNLALDKNTVRIAAIRAFATIQGESIPHDFKEAVVESPKEILLLSFRDVSWDCRLTAVEVFVPTTSDHVRYLAQIALSDKSLKVRELAIKSFGKLPMSASEAPMKLNLVYKCLTDHDRTIRDAVKKHVIDVWLSALTTHYLMFKEHLKQQMEGDPDVIEVTHTGEKIELESGYTKKQLGYIHAASCLMIYFGNLCDKEVYTQVRLIMMSAFESVRQMYNIKHEPMEWFGGAVFADIAPNDLLFVRGSCEQVLERHKYDIEKLANHVFFWRLTVEFIIENARDKTDRQLGIDRIVPDVVKMVVLVYKCVDLFQSMEKSGNVGDWPMFRVRQTAIIQSLLMIIRHKEKDPCGEKAWIDLLTDVYFTISNPKTLVDTVTQDLAVVKYGETMIAEIAAGISDMMKRASCGDETLRDETVFIGSATAPEVTPEQRDYLVEIMNYELPLIHAALKADTVRELDAILRTKYQTLIKPHMTSENVEYRLFAIECVGIIGTFDFDFIENELVEIWRSFDEQPMDIKCSIVTILGDLSIHYNNVDIVSDRIRKLQTERIQQKSSVTGFLCDIILTNKADLEFSEVVIKSVEVLAKMLLNLETNPDDLKWQKSLIALMSVTNFAADDSFKAVIRSLVTAFLKFFAAKWENQMLVAKSFKQFFIEWDTNPTLIDKVGPNADIYNRLKRNAELFAILTRHSALSKKETRLPVHVNLLRDALTEVLSNQESAASNYYCEILHWIEFDSIPKDELRRFVDEIDELVLIYAEGDSKGRLSHLKKFQKRLHKETGTKEVEEEIDIVKQEVESPEYESAVPPSAKRIARKLMKNTPARRNIAQDIDETIDAPSMSRPQRQPLESRSHLKRTTRRP